MADVGDKTGPRDQDRRPRELARLAARQLGVVTREQLYELGFTYEETRTMVRQARLHPLHRDVFAVGHPRVTGRALLLAAQLSVGPRSFLSHRSAAVVWDLRPMNTHDIELTVVGGSARQRKGLTIHRTREAPHPRDVRRNGHLHVSSVMRLLVELSPREKPAELERLVRPPSRSACCGPTSNRAWPTSRPPWPGTSAGRARPP